MTLPDERPAAPGPSPGPTPTARTRAPGRTEREERHQVVIIGSGVGGSITAFRLAMAGVPNLVLERGHRWPVTPSADTFPGLPWPDRRMFWHEGDLVPRPPTGASWWPRLGARCPAVAAPHSTGLLDISLHPTVATVCGAGVGGGTLVYGGMLPQPKPGVFRRVFPAEIDYDELDRTYYPRARVRLGGSPFPLDLLSHPRYRTTRLWHRALTDAGFEPEPVVSAYDFDIVHAELAGKAPPAVTTGQYWVTGCDSGAKMSVDRTYLARAEATGKTQVRPLHRVAGIGHGPDGRYRVTVERLTARGAVIERLVLGCDRLVMAAGGVHTPRLLVTARDTGALPGLNEHVGTQWGTNGDQTSVVKTWRAPTGGRQAGPPGHLARSQDGSIMVAHGPVRTAAAARLMLCTGLGVPDRYGHWTYSPETGRAHLNWQPGSDASTQRAVSELMARITRHVPGGAMLLRPMSRYPLVLHPLGGAPIGKATDQYGRVHGCPGLYCLDSALMPGSTAAVNPVLTIAAIVERCLDHVIGDFIQ
ncbi:GMC oxidoreductase [Streptomyces alfalfae]|uniref:Cholesterol oxidase n=1 Tax=Streptomyces alfalfae TaxID=1642299 RepID=A0A7T4PLF8_9ACTN|nr:GMC oxidoreductase [Streptomyces alfalfae]QQC92396.1 GMC family oxidoreductase [Streptomyces alfalfae]